MELTNILLLCVLVGMLYFAFNKRVESSESSVEKDFGDAYDDMMEQWNAALN